MPIKLLHTLFIALTAVSLTAITQANTPSATIPIGLVKLSDHPDHRSRTWTGIGRLRGNNTSFCTASLIDTRTTHNPTGNTPAYLITSHRCLNTKNHGEYNYAGGVQHDIPAQGAVYFNNFDNTLDTVKRYELKTINWQSDGGLNLAIIELKATLSELIAEGIQPLKIARGTPATDTQVLTLGIPEFSNLHATQCTQLAAVDVASYPWVGSEILANQCANLTAGGQGGPVLDRASNELISVVVASTHGVRSTKKCLANAPCELKAGAAHWSPDTHYTQPVSFLNQCFVQGQLAVNIPACGLYKLTSIAVQTTQHPPARIIEKLSTDIDTGPDAFEVGLTLDSPLYRYKYTHDAKECRHGAHYSQALSSADATINFTLDEAVGMHMLCIVSVDTADGSLTSAQFNAARIITTERVAINPPAPSMEVIRTRYHGEYYVVHWYHRAPLLNYYTIKYGPYSATDCTQPDGYNPLLDYEERLRNSGPWASSEYDHKDHPSNPLAILVKETKEQLVDGAYSKFIKPKENIFKLCTVLYDLNNQPSEPRTDILRPL